jgi:hypothetical protein
MASIDTRPDGQHRVRWREGGRQRAKHFPANEKRQARAFAATVEADPGPRGVHPSRRRVDNPGGVRHPVP